MKVRNKSSGKIITSNCKKASSFLSRLKGLMFSPPQDLLLVSPKENIPSTSIHMFFMKFPLDVIWINSKKRIVDIKKDIPPLSILNPNSWKIYRPQEKAKYVLELRTRSVENSESKVGDEVEIMEEKDQ